MAAIFHSLGATYLDNRGCNRHREEPHFLLVIGSKDVKGHVQENSYITSAGLWIILSLSPKKRFMNIKMNIRANFEMEKKCQNGSSCYKYVSIFLYFFKFPFILFFMTTMDGGYGQNTLKTLWTASLLHPTPPTLISLLPPSGGVLLFHLSSRVVKPKALLEQ